MWKFQINCLITFSSTVLEEAKPNEKCCNFNISGWRTNLDTREACKMQQIIDRLLYSSPIYHHRNISYKGGLTLLSEDYQRSERKHAINKKPIKREKCTKNIFHTGQGDKSKAYQNTSHHKRIICNLHDGKQFLHLHRFFGECKFNSSWHIGSRCGKRCFDVSAFIEKWLMMLINVEMQFHFFSFNLKTFISDVIIFSKEASSCWLLRCCTRLLVSFFGWKNCYPSIQL